MWFALYFGPIVVVWLVAAALIVWKFQRNWWWPVLGALLFSAVWSYALDLATFGLD
jgi:hypothetical protein